MKPIKIPVILETLDLGEYHKDLQGQSLLVWVNPTQQVFDQRDAALLKWAGAADVVDKKKQAETQQVIDQIEAEMNAWFLKVWSQGPDETRPGMDDLIEWNKYPAFSAFLKRRTMELIAAHQDGKKKA